MEEICEWSDHRPSAGQFKFAHELDIVRIGQRDVQKPLWRGVPVQLFVEGSAPQPERYMTKAELGTDVADGAPAFLNGGGCL